MSTAHPLIQFKTFSGYQPYSDIFDKMKAFTINRTHNTTNEVWLMEHLPVFTQGQAGKAEHILNTGDIPIIQSDRGGQVTYHGPGQLMIYFLWDLKQFGLGVRQLVCQLEQFVIDLLTRYLITAHRMPKAPGIYVDQKKIASIGLRVKKGACYHGISLNVSMDLTPFSYINPCGFENLQMTQIADFVPNITVSQIAQDIIMLIQAWESNHLATS